MTFHSEKHWASFLNIPKMQYCTMQVSALCRAILANTESLQNITVQLETNLINYTVKPKVHAFISIFIHGLAASFFCFSALNSR